MKSVLACVLLVGSSLLPAAAGRAQSAAQPAAPARAGASEVEALRAEIERLRREAEEARRKQEERIRALEQKLQELQKAAPAPAPAPAAPAPQPVTTRPGFRARLYGFARADVDVDTHKLFAGPHLPFWVLSPDHPQGANASDGDFTIHPRLTRLGLDTEAPAVRRLGDARPSGKIEIDFLNMLPDRNSATSNSRGFVRIRHAYGRLDWKRASLLFGQTWDLISPLFPTANDDVLMWNAGNLGDRRPQVRLTWEPAVGKGKATLAAAIASPSAVDSQDLDADQIVDGEESRRPLLQARAAISQPSWVRGQNWELGLWGHQSAFRVDRAFANTVTPNRNLQGHRHFDSFSAGLDLRLPITRRLLLQGEAWFGKTLADVRGGVGQTINLLTGGEVRSRGGWAELLYRVNEAYTLGGGFTLDDPTDEDVTPFNGANAATVGRTLNRTYYIVNRLNLGGGFTLGVDWMLFHTDFRGIRGGTANRWNIWLRHDF